MVWNYEPHISALTQQARLHFYELLAHNLTVCVRSVWSDKKLCDAEKVERMKRLNEIQHRVTAKIWSTRLEADDWSEGDFSGIFDQWTRDIPALEHKVESSIQRSYRSARARGL